MKFPDIPKLQDTKEAKEKFDNLIKWIGKDSDAIRKGRFEFENVNFILGLSFIDIQYSPIDELDRLIMEAESCIVQLQVYENHVDRVLAFVDAELSRAVAMIYPGLLKDQFGKEAKVYTLAEHYPVVAWLRDNGEFYQQYKLNLTGIVKTLEYRRETLIRRHNARTD